jgi:hypothetical protein
MACRVQCSMQRSAVANAAALVGVPFVRVIDRRATTTPVLETRKRTGAMCGGHVRA